MECLSKLEIPNEVVANNNENNNIDYQLDNTDFKIISLLVLGLDNKKISSTLKIPLSTIQRRTRRILLSGMIKLEYTPNFKKLGIKKGLLHIYLSDGQLRKTAEKTSEMEGVLSSNVHVGNSDIVSEFVYENNEDLVDIVAEIKQIQGVEKVVWSEEVFKVPERKENIMKSFNKYWDNKIFKESKRDL